MSCYEEMAMEFAKKHGVELEVLGFRYDRYFDDYDRPRYIFKMRLTRNGKRYTFEFGQSIADGSKEPTMYDVLACLQKYDVGTFENFCYEFGYDTDSRRAERTYKAVCKEYAAVVRLFGDIMD